MIVSLNPTLVIDFISNLLLIALCIYLLVTVKKIRDMRPSAPLWMYLHWQVIALSVFAFSHSIGHIVRRVLIMGGHSELWDTISPITGSINSLTFVVVAILSFLYKDLETASEKYGTLREAKKELEASLKKLKQTSVQMEKDAREIFSKNKELYTLNKIAMAVSKSLEMDKVLSAVMKEVRGFMEADYIGIYLVEGDKLVLKAYEGLSEEFQKTVAVRDIGEPWLKRHIMARKPFFTRERLEEHTGNIDASLKLEGMQAWAAVPLVAKGAVVGALAVGSSKYDGINSSQIETLTTIGGYVGVVIENSELYEELKLKVEDLERFRRFSVGREMRIIELKEKLKGQGRNK